MKKHCHSYNESALSHAVATLDGSLDKERPHALETSVHTSCEFQPCARLGGLPLVHCFRRGTARQFGDEPYVGFKCVVANGRDPCNNGIGANSHKHQERHCRDQLLHHCQHHHYRHRYHHILNTVLVITKTAIITHTIKNHHHVPRSSSASTQSHHHRQLYRQHHTMNHSVIIEIAELPSSSSGFLTISSQPFSSVATPSPFPPLRLSQSSSRRHHNHVIKIIVTGLSV